MLPLVLTAKVVNLISLLWVRLWGAERSSGSAVRNKRTKNSQKSYYLVLYVGPAWIAKQKVCL
jgi:hypothetical protein